jgi:hypothetical protein
LIDELAGFGGAVGARGKFFPLDWHSGGIDDALGGRRNLGADAFAGDNCDFVAHGCIVLYAKGKLLSKGGSAGCSKGTAPLCS